MKEKMIYYTRASFAALFLAILGYTVAFYPSRLEVFDTSIQSAVRGELSDATNRFWSLITVVGEVLPIILLVLGLVCFFYYKKWKAEIYFLLGGMSLMAVLSTALKLFYQRPRPTIEWIVTTTGYSFPSWHTASTMMLAGILVIIVQQRIHQRRLSLLWQGCLLLIAGLVAVSRIYVGVHYPTDIIGGWLLAIFLLNLLFPLYEHKRFIWRFQGKQK